MLASPCRWRSVKIPGSDGEGEPSDGERSLPSDEDEDEDEEESSWGEGDDALLQSGTVNGLRAPDLRATALRLVKGYKIVLDATKNDCQRPLLDRAAHFSA
jgi:hypothetical protein